MEILNNDHYRNIGGMYEPDVVIEEPKPKRTFGDVLNNIFGVAERAVNIWKSSKATAPGDVGFMPGAPPEPKKVLGMPPIAGYTVIIAGSALAVYLIYTKVIK